MRPGTRVLLLVGVQAFLVGGLLAYHGFTVATGTEVLLETAPVDPRDLFRGDYMALRYEISRVEVPDPLAYEPGDRVYVTLEARGRYHDAVSVHGSRPDVDEGQACIRGTVRNVEAAAGERYIEAEYGIESFFFREGSAPPPPGDIEARVRLDRFCHAVLVALLVDGREWEPHLYDAG